MRQTALGSEYWNQLHPALQEVISRHFEEPLDEFLRDVLQECQNVPIEEALRGLRLFMSSLEMPREFSNYIERKGYANYPAEFYGLKPTAPFLWKISLGINSYKDKALSQYAAALINPFIAHGSPTFWVGKDFARAALLTDPPDDVKVCDLPTPFPITRYVLPFGAIHTPSGEAIQQIFVAKLDEKNGQPDEILRKLTGHCGFQVHGTIPEHNSVFVFCLYQGAHGVTYLHAFFPDSLHLNEVPPMAARLQNLVESSEQDRGTIITDSKFGNCAYFLSTFRLAFNLALIAAAEPGLVEHGRQIRGASAPAGGKKNGKGLYSPGFIGKVFSLPGPASIISGEGLPGVDPHWRRGHYTNQPYGKDNQLRKRIWLKPIYVLGPANRAKMASEKE